MTIARVSTCHPERKHKGLGLCYPCYKRARRKVLVVKPEIKDLPKGFYTYLWLREDGTPYYVGKGRFDRAFSKHRVGNPPPKCRVIVYEWENEDTAFAYEMYLIYFYGRKDLGTGCLRNLTDGGEGNSGYIASVETRKKIGEANFRKRGSKRSEETKRRMSEAAKGRTFSESTRSKMSDAAKHRWSKPVKE